MFDIYKIWNYLSIAQTKLLDEKHNGTTTFTFSRTTANVQYIARSNRKKLPVRLRKYCPCPEKCIIILPTIAFAALHITKFYPYCKK